MSSTARDAKPSRLAASTAHRYFRAIEECFLEWRGSPLTLGAADWQLARSWFEQGLPISLVTETLEEIFERRDDEGKDKVSSLRYFRPVIENAWQSRQELQAPARQVETPDIDVQARLEALARALPQELLERGQWQQRLQNLTGPPQEVEQELARLDERLRHDIRQSLPETVRQGLEEKLQRSLDKLAGRLPAAELERASQRLADQLLRQVASLPVLSLFSSEALAE